MKPSTIAIWDVLFDYGELTKRTGNIENQKLLEDAIEELHRIEDVLEGRTPFIDDKVIDGEEFPGAKCSLCGRNITEEEFIEEESKCCQEQVVLGMTEEQWNNLTFMDQMTIIEKRICPFCSGIIDSIIDEDGNADVICDNCGFKF